MFDFQVQQRCHVLSFHCSLLPLCGPLPCPGWDSGSLLMFCFSFVLLTPEVLSLFPHPASLCLHVLSLHFCGFHTRSGHLSEAPPGRREPCGCLHQGHMCSFSNPFALTGLSLGFAPPEPEWESLTFCLLFCSLILGLKMLPVPFSCGLHVINQPSLFLPLYLCRTRGMGQC